jgi:ssDNA-specific exonuclease RecJ
MRFNPNEISSRNDNLRTAVSKVLKDAPPKIREQIKSVIAEQQPATIYTSCS